MAKTVYKYPLEVAEFTTLSLTGPIVHVGVQNVRPGYSGDLCLWAESGVHAPVARTFHVVGTGHDAHYADEHIGSVIVDPFVWHIYETGL